MHKNKLHASKLFRHNAAMNTAVKKVKPKGRPPGSKREDTLAKLMPIARRLFAERGFAQTTFKDIGKELGLSHAALYAYFDSKVDLYVATLADTQALLLPHYIEAIEQSKNFKERLTGILMASAKAHDEDSTITGFLASVLIEVRRHEEIRGILLGQNNAVMDALETVFAEGKQSGEIKSTASVSDLAAALYGGGIGVALYQYGMQADNLSDAMSVFVELIEAKLFS